MKLTAERPLVAAALCVLCSVDLAAQGRTMVLVPSVPESTTEVGKMADSERVTRCLFLHLHERLAEITGVELVSESWAGDLLFEIEGGKRVAKPDNLLEALRAFLPLDAAVSCESRDGRYACLLHLRNGVRVRDFPCPKGVPVAEIVYPAAGFVADELRLGEPAKKALTEQRVPDSKALEACHLSRRLNTVWIINSGEVRLALMRPFMDHLGKYPYLAGVALSAGTRLWTDGREVKDAKRSLDALRLALVAALGTAYEHEAYEFLRHNRYSPAQVESDLLALVRQQAKTESEQVLDDEKEETDTGDVPVDTALEGTALLVAKEKSAAQQAGAIRCLGILKSAATLQLMTGLAGSGNPVIRQACAFALGQYGQAEADKLLAGLATDPDQPTAFVATYQLWNRGQGVPSMLAVARTAVSRPNPLLEAVEVLSLLGTAEDVERLARFERGADRAQRVLAVRGLLRLKAADGAMLSGWLASGCEEVVVAALSQVPPEIDENVRQRLFGLANDPHEPVAEGARRALTRFRPPADPDRLRFDLRTEHLYLRLRILEKLAVSGEAQATDLLAEAAANSAPQVRAQAARRLAERDPRRACQVLPRLLGDPYRWVRVHAAAVAADIASPELAPALRSALEIEKGLVCRLYLQDALAKAEGRPLPEPRRPVNRFDPSRNTFGLCGCGTEAPVSPFGYYYLLGVELSQSGREAHEKGKIIVGRSNKTAHNPMHAIFHPIWRDLWWLSMEKELADLEWLDGVVLGEESMGFGPWQLWKDGWRLFCLEAGLDPDRVSGDRQKLSPYEQRAWLHWEQERAIDGFNVMYDFIKLYFGKLRPGFMVGTFMPHQNGPCVADRRWKFDVGGAYHYGATNRERYNTIRRFRTLWPGRPVIWLSIGNVGTPSGDVKYNSPVPGSLVQERTTRAYADSVCAWLAGAEAGFFTSWLFTAKDTPPGAFGFWVGVEDLQPGSSTLQKGIEHCFGGIEEMYRFEATAGKPQLKVPDTAEEKPDEVDKVLEGRDVDKEAHERVLKEMERLRVGFHLEQKQQYDIARALAGLPRPQPRHEALFVCPWDGIPQFDVAGDYDFLVQVNKLADQDLGTYRLIGIARHGDSPLQDRTIEALTAWLRDQPGLLYIRGTLLADNSAEASTPEDHDGVLQRDWPWEADVICDGPNYRVTGAGAHVLRSDEDKPRLVLWKKPGFKGAVLFDQATQDAAEFRAVLDKIVVEHRVGLALQGPVGMLRGERDGVTGVASTYGAPEPFTVKGVDLLTGEANPVVQKGRSAAVVAADCSGTFTASFNGVSVLCDRPMTKVERIAGGLRVECSGLIRVGSVTGAVVASPEGDGPVPTVEGDEKVVEWLLFGKAPGIAVVKVPGSDASVIFIRCPRPVLLKPRQP